MTETSSYEDVNERLKEIVEAVSDETLPLDDALDLFEEAVKLGMEASTMMEDDMAARDAEMEAEEQAADEAFAAVVNDQDAEVPAEVDEQVGNTVAVEVDEQDTEVPVEVGEQARDAVAVEIEDGDTEVPAEIDSDTPVWE